jgi:formamidopyrimidine-DNA glycosylase
VPAGFAKRLTGARVENFRRRGKYILIRLSGGDSVLLHLGMSGRMNIAPDLPLLAASIPVLHEHLVLVTDQGMRVAFVDPRRFGSLDLVATADEDQHRLLADLGREPLEPGFDGKSLAASLAGRRTPLKAALLDQSVVAGLGNIYVCEALFRAKLSPRRMASSIIGVRAVRLAAAIRQTLTEAVAAGGSSLRDYVQPSGELGYFQHAWKVYGRAGKPCELCPGEPDCGGIERLVQSGRSTFFCGRLQR